MSPHPTGTDNDRYDQDAGLPQFELVSAAHSATHALVAGSELTAVLCGLAAPDAGWDSLGLTDRIYRIDCAACRAQAAHVLSAFNLPSDQSEIETP